MKLTIEKIITVDDTGLPKAPSVRQLQDKDLLELYNRDGTPDKRKYIKEVGVIYYLGDPKSPPKQKGYSDSECLKEAIENYNLPTDYKPDIVVKSLIAKYEQQNKTEAGIALENLNKSLHLISLFATKINEILSNKLSNIITIEDIATFHQMSDAVSKKISEIPNLTKALSTAYENLRNEEEEQFARGGKKILSSMDADEDF